MIDHTLEELSNDLLDPQQFFRISRQHIINIDTIQEVKSFHNNRLELVLNIPYEDKLVVSRGRVTDFKNWLNDCLGFLTGLSFFTSPFDHYPARSAGWESLHLFSFLLLSLTSFLAACVPGKRVTRNLRSRWTRTRNSSSFATRMLVSRGTGPKHLQCDFS